MNGWLLKALAAALIVWAPAAHAEDAPLRLAVPAEMVDSGFMQHLLPRFRFKTRISIEPVVDGGAADAAFEGGPDGARIFQDDATTWFLVRRADDPRIDRFLEWLKSTPGQAAIEGFPADGPAIYSTAAPVETVVETVSIDGDAEMGARLAIVHCGRCHVVDERNRMGGIGSTPSFAALRGRTAWSDLFQAFWSANPHPSFTEVVGITEPFSATHVTHIAPVRITTDEIDAITAFVETIVPKDLGRPVQSQ